MTRVVCFVLGLAFIILGFLGFTNWVPALSNTSIYLNVGEIILGIVGLLFGMYSSRGSERSQQINENNKLRKVNDQYKKDGSDQLLAENEQLKKEIAQMQIDRNEQLQRENRQAQDQTKSNMQ